MEFSRPEYWGGQPFPSPGYLPNPGIEPRSPAMQADSLPAEPQGKPKNTVVDSLSLLQQIFLIQELNRGLLHCRRILYQLSYQGSLEKTKWSEGHSVMSLCDPMDYTVHGNLQARILEWVAVPFSRGSSRPRDWTQVSLIDGGFFTSWGTRETQTSDDRFAPNSY